MKSSMNFELQSFKLQSEKLINKNDYENDS